MNINYEVNRLINFALQNNLINKLDAVYASNLILEVLELNEFEEVEVNETLNTPTSILENILDYAVEKGMIENTITERDLFDTKVMNCVMPRPSEVIRTFNEKYNKDKKEATKYYYNMSIASNYIRKDRTDQNIVWKTPTEYGDLDITINLSKPEKDPRDIAKAKLMKATSYPKCLLCKENEGFKGNINHPARQNHRIIPMEFAGDKWFLQYSPYVYYNEHCIILNAKHIPMKITKKTFANLLGFIDQLPHYFAGSNADLPIVGGSILSHDHYQGGNYTFAMEVAQIEETFNINGFDKTKVSRVKWPMSVVRLNGENKEEILDLADHILNSWRSYSDDSVEIINETNGEPHNTITPIARKIGNVYELDLVLRNNRTSEEHPMGIFHPHNEVHHIKKENIGLIEVMGLAVLPARLKEELNTLGELLVQGVESIDKNEVLNHHASWYKQIRDNYTDITTENVENILRDEVGNKFSTVLEHAGVFKRNEVGIAAFNKFIKSL
ncbi:UDP-glucose--hexose-1-phosphate uridylyltransferase [Romboutsia sp.]|uniref:UDP-glucose--hexose-1-phosphate uridylyltransferase n=1 Tax=Romboutsia sp. TaxID=1965302 RepID=UPI003F3B8711